MPESDNASQKAWVLGITSLASFMVALDTQVLTSALATIRAEFGAPMEILQWTVTAFNLSFAVLLLTGAALGDRFGRRRLFAAGILLFVVSSVACALSTGILSLIAARIAQGAGSALIMPLGMALLSTPFQKKNAHARSASSAAWWVSRCWRGRQSAAPSPRAWDGRGSSGSIFRSGCSRP